VSEPQVRERGVLASAGPCLPRGQPESSLIVTLATAAWLAYRRPALRTGHWRRRGLVLGVALAAVMLVPFAEALRQSYDTSAAHDGAAGRSLSRWCSPSGGAGRTAPGSRSAPPTHRAHALRGRAAAAARGGGAWFARRPRGPQLFFAAMGVVALLLALNTGPLTKGIRHIPICTRPPQPRARAGVVRAGDAGGVRLRAAAARDAEERRRC